MCDSGCNSVAELWAENWNCPPKTLQHFLIRDFSFRNQRNQEYCSDSQHTSLILTWVCSYIINKNQNCWLIDEESWKQRDKERKRTKIQEKHDRQEALRPQMDFRIPFTPKESCCMALVVFRESVSTSKHRPISRVYVIKDKKQHKHTSATVSASLCNLH